MSIGDWIGFFGAVCLLVAFLLNLGGTFQRDNPWYVLLNFVGAGFALWASYLANLKPIMIIAGVWTAVSLIAFLREAVYTAQKAKRHRKRRSRKRRSSKSEDEVIGID